MSHGRLTESALLPPELEPEFLFRASSRVSQKRMEEAAELEECEEGRGGRAPSASSSPRRVRMGGSAWRARVLLPEEPESGTGIGERGYVQGRRDGGAEEEALSEGHGHAVISGRAIL